MTIAPDPSFPERPGTSYERRLDTQPTPGRKGMARFYEGVASDTDVPTEFGKGASQGWVTPAGRPNHNMAVHTKPAAETMAERAHVGSAAWTEAPEFLGEFAQGSFSDYAEVRYEEKWGMDARSQRPNPAVVRD